jgi:hypothetical protein
MRLMSHDQDWRLQLDLEEPGDLERLIGEVRGTDRFERDERASLGGDVVLTHDGSRFFAYAMSEQALQRARDATQPILHQQGLKGTIRLSHWDEDRREWRQTDPPLPEFPPEPEQTAPRWADSGSASRQETRAIACTFGRLTRKPFEQQMVNYARELGLRCEIVEHPHLLSTQVAFNLTGSQSKIEAFAQYLRSEARATTRLDPGLVPFGFP